MNAGQAITAAMQAQRARDCGRFARHTFHSWPNTEWTLPCAACIWSDVVTGSRR